LNKDEVENTPKFIRPYTKVEDELREGIRSGVWVAGSRLPSRAPLARHYGVALSTLDRAIMGLVREGIVRVSDRKGTYVVGVDERNSIMPAGAACPAKGLQTVAVVFDHFSGAVTVDTIPDPWFATVIGAIQRQLNSKGVQTLVHNRWTYEGGLRPLSHALEECVDNGVDFIVILGMHGIQGTNKADREQISADAIELLYWYNQDKLPVVCITSSALRQPIPHVFYDLYYEGYRAGEYMLNQGYKRITFFRSSEAPWIDDRIAGCKQAIADYRRAANDDIFSVYPPQPGPRLEDVNEVDVAERWARELLSNNAAMQPGMAVIAGNDNMAYGLVKACLSTDHYPGITFGLVSFDDLSRTAMMSVSSFRPPLEAMATEAVAMGVRMVNKEATGLQLRLPSTLSERSSSAPYTG